MKENQTDSFRLEQSSDTKFLQTENKNKKLTVEYVIDCGKVGFSKKKKKCLQIG